MSFQPPKSFVHLQTQLKMLFNDRVSVPPLKDSEGDPPFRRWTLWWV